MERLHPLFFTSLISLTLIGCSSSTDPEPISESPAPPVIDENESPEPIAPSTRLACENHDADADSLLLSPVLDLTSYPRYDDYLDSAFVEREALVPVISALVSSSVNTVLITRCPYELFEANACGFIATGSLEDDVLKWTLATNTSTLEVTVNDRSYSSGSVVTSSANGEEETMLWTRAADGTETFSRTDLIGNTTSFTEAPDCSGTATFVDFEDDGTPLVKTTSTWTSPIEAIPRFVWESCDYENGVEECRQSP